MKGELTTPLAGNFQHVNNVTFFKGYVTLVRSQC
jgi:hypothetical protein